MDDHTIGLVSLLIGLASLAISFVFYTLGAKAERRNKEILGKIDQAVATWQGKIMESSIELLNSRVEIVGKQAVLENAKTKHEFLRNLSERIKFIVENPASGDLVQAQSYNLQLLLKTFEETTKSILPPDAIAQIVAQSQGQPRPRGE
jgi:hypothetical protein